MPTFLSCTNTGYLSKRMDLGTLKEIVTLEGELEYS